MNAKKARRNILEQYGKIPDLTYFPGDMTSIGSFFEYMKRNHGKAYIDDVTWFDLDMENVFKRINMGLSNAGEQYLYYMLRFPVANEQDYIHRKALINFIRQNPKLRTALSIISRSLADAQMSIFMSCFILNPPSTNIYSSISFCPYYLSRLS